MLPQSFHNHPGPPLWLPSILVLMSQLQDVTTEATGGYRLPGSRIEVSSSFPPYNRRLETSVPNRREYFGTGIGADGGRDISSGSFQGTGTSGDELKMFSWKEESGRTRTPKHGIILDFENSAKRKTPGSSEEGGERDSSGTHERVLQYKSAPKDLDVSPEVKGRDFTDPDPPWNENMEIKASDYLLPGRLRNNSSQSQVSPGKDDADAYVPARRKLWKRRSKERKVLGKKTWEGNKNKNENIIENGFIKEMKRSVKQEMSELDIREIMETDESKESEKQKWVVEEKRGKSVSKKQKKLEEVKEENGFKNTAPKTTTRGKKEAEDNTKTETEEEGNIFRDEEENVTFTLLSTAPVREVESPFGLASEGRKSHRDAALTR
ncbi:uncharacterized protein LOC119582297 [Penaeus monodon]|uniref:uncharacterized protein LOC119582297 n=1 Tax=Penaeus monodon TaxID=6687 RepID=UPI0018A6F3DE|nr:uncharacterized protein LOC119582297 [Penaeus monodon]